MQDQFHADGETWRVTSDEDDRRRAVRTVVFHCISNPQRPYRVVEVPDELLGGRAVESLEGDHLDDLFRRSHTMDYTHDPGANPGQHGTNSLY